MLELASSINNLSYIIAIDRSAVVEYFWKIFGEIILASTSKEDFKKKLKEKIFQNRHIFYKGKRAPYIKYFSEFYPFSYEECFSKSWNSFVGTSKKCNGFLFSDQKFEEIKEIFEKKLFFYQKVDFYDSCSIKGFAKYLFIVL